MTRKIVSKSLTWYRNDLEDGVEFVAPVTSINFDVSTGSITMSYSIYEPLDETPEIYLLYLGLNAENFEIGQYQSLDSAAKEAEKHHKNLLMEMSKPCSA